MIYLRLSDINRGDSYEIFMKEMKEKKDQSQKPSLSWRVFWSSLFELLKPFKSLVLRIFALIIVIVLFDLAKPYILKLVIDALTDYSSLELSYLLMLILFYLGSDQARSLLQYFSDRYIFKFLVKAEYYMGMKSQDKLLELSLGYHERENTGAKIVKIERGIDRISNLSQSIFWEMAPTVVQFIFTITALFWADWRVGLSFIIFAPLFLFITFWTNAKLYQTRKEIYHSYEKASGKMTQAIININAVKSFAQEARELSDFSYLKTGIMNKEGKQWSWLIKMGLVRNLIVDIGRASILFLGVYLIYQGVMGIGTLIFAFTLSEKAYSSLYRLSRFYDRMEDGREGVSRLLTLLSAQSEVIEKEHASGPESLIGEIEFKDICFIYHESNSRALHEVSFKIKALSTVALVGPSGGGKTTIARLIYRHYDPLKGQILIDGQDVRDFKLSKYRSFLGIVPQEVEVFDVSVRDNIAYARADASMAEVIAAAKIANAHEFISKLGQGYDTLVGERGMKLSGGQRQRIGIARAILADPKILIFDEATSSLDSESERLIQLALEKLAKQRTLIIIAHRLSTIKQADRIIVLKNGRIAEEGSHVELADLDNGVYAKLLRLQQFD